MSEAGRGRKGDRERGSVRDDITSEFGTGHRVVCGKT